jgi:hypothetical protein
LVFAAAGWFIFSRWFSFGGRDAKGGFLGVVCIFVVFATVVNLTAAAVIRAMGHTNFNLIILRDLIAHHTPLIDPVDILRDLMYGWWIAFLNSCRPVIEKPGLARLARYLKSFCHYGFPDLGPIIANEARYVTPQDIETRAIDALVDRCMAKIGEELDRRMSISMARLLEMSSRLFSRTTRFTPKLRNT